MAPVHLLDLHCTHLCALMGKNELLSQGRNSEGESECVLERACSLFNFVFSSSSRRAQQLGGPRISSAVKLWILLPFLGSFLKSPALKERQIINKGNEDVQSRRKSLHLTFIFILKVPERRSLVCALVKFSCSAQDM